MDNSMAQKSLLSMGPDALGEVFSFLNAYDIASLWFIGSSSLINTLSSRVRSFILEVVSHKKPIWPKLVSNFPMLYTCAIYPDESISYLAFTEFDLTIIPPNVRKVNFHFELALEALSRYRSHFSNLESISAVSSMIQASSNHEDILLPESTTHFDTLLYRNNLVSLNVSSLPPGLNSLSGYFGIFKFEENVHLPASLTKLELVLSEAPNNFIARLPPLLRHFSLEIAGYQATDHELRLLPSGLTSLTLCGVFNPASPNLDEISRKQNLVELGLWPSEPCLTVERLVQILPPSITKVNGFWLSSTHITAPQAAMLPRSLISIDNFVTFSADAIASLPPNFEYFCQYRLEDVHPDLDTAIRPLRMVRLGEINSKNAKALPLSITYLQADTIVTSTAVDLSRYNNLQSIEIFDTIHASTSKVLLPPNLTLLKVDAFLSLEPSPFENLQNLHNMQVLKIAKWDLPASALPASLLELRIGIHTLDYLGVSQLPRRLRTLALRLSEEPETDDWDLFIEALPRTLTDLTLELRTFESWATELYPEDLQWLPRGLMELVVPHSAAFSHQAEEKYTTYIPSTLVSLLVGGKEPHRWRHHHKQATHDSRRDSAQRQTLFDEAVLDTLFI